MSRWGTFCSTAPSYFLRNESPTLNSISADRTFLIFDLKKGSLEGETDKNPVDPFSRNAKA